MSLNVVTYEIIYKVALSSSIFFYISILSKQSKHN